MSNDSSALADSEKNTLNRLSTALRQRIRARGKSDIVAYFDEVFPALEYMTVASPSIDDDRQVYRLDDFLAFHDREFIEHCYRCILKREADPEGIEWGLTTLRASPRCARILYLGKLCESEEALAKAVEVIGLDWRYSIAQRLPFGLSGRLLRILVYGDELLAFDYGAGRQAILVQESDRQTESLQKALDRVEDVEAVALQGGFESKLPWPRDGDHAAQVRASTLTQYLGLREDDFILAGYQLVLQREPEPAERQAAVRQLGQEETSRARFLEQLCESDEAVVSTQGILGLKSALRREKLQRLPLVGGLVSSVEALLALPRLERVMSANSREIAESIRRQRLVEERLITHYNKSIINLKSELIQALRDDAP